MNAKVRVLLVDDEEPFAVNLSRLLQNRNFEVITTFNGFQAIEAVRSADAFDVAVLDVKMPGMDGIATLKAIKKQYPEANVIFGAGHDTGNGLCGWVYRAFYMSSHFRNESIDPLVAQFFNRSPTVRSKKFKSPRGLFDVELYLTVTAPAFEFDGDFTPAGKPL